MTDSEIVDAIISREGGFVDLPADKGGPTKFGITAARLAEHRGGSMVDASDVKQLTVNAVARRTMAQVVFPEELIQ